MEHNMLYTGKLIYSVMGLKTISFDHCIKGRTGRSF